VTTQGQTFTPENSNFDPLYAGTAPVEGMGMRFDFAPWNIGAPQPVVVALEKAGGFAGAVLDAGCGRGENAIYLASRGYRVTGVDRSPSAVAQATENAAGRGVEVEFAVADATRLDGVEPGFATALDYGLYHCLNDEQRREYAAALHRVCAPGARLHLFSFADTAPPGLPPAWLRVSQDNLHANLDRHWRIRSISNERSTTKFTREFLVQQRSNAPAGAVAVDPEALDVDENGCILLPMMHVQADRS
jgi:SAM-dependent methyltransferase